MFGVAAVVAFGSGHADVQSFVLGGFLLLALHLVTGWQPWHRGT